MRVGFVEIQNFRKLKSIRIDFSEQTTLFVGANNSGKTSAMVALSQFLIDRGLFTTNDFTLSNWAIINDIGVEWESHASAENVQLPTLSIWETVLPSLDLWFNVATNEIHYVRNLLPTLSWTGGLLGVRLRFEPKDITELHKEYLTAVKTAGETKKAGAKDRPTGQEYTLSLWPKDLRHFLERRMNALFTIRGYLLDPSRCESPSNGIANPQSLSADSEPIEGDPLNGLIRIDKIDAQRGLGESSRNRQESDDSDGYASSEVRTLSVQLRSYYTKHLDPSEAPEPADLDALQAIEEAQRVFDERLAFGFSAAMTELESLNYPGVTDPKLTIATRMRPTDGLNHTAAVQYEILSEDGKVVTTSLRLPEAYNGLGYQNLISMVFRLMSFRDAWMRVGKAGKTTSGLKADQHSLPPIHLVLIEEPEAHLHAQVQQVFVRKAYDVLRNHEDLREKPILRTQLIVSTHSSHVAHEAKFDCLRYFRRLPAKAESTVPTSSVINLSEVFGPTDQTEKFVTRYLKATHCDLFFADAAILVEGPTERMLVPHFIGKHFPELHGCYVTLLEIGGSHAHRLRKLIEHLGLTTLIITDLDATESTGTHKATSPQRSCHQVSRNETLKSWHPENESLDELLDLPEEKKVKEDYEIPLFAVRVAYQVPIEVKFKEEDKPSEAIATTLEDSLVFENLNLFKELVGHGMVKKFRDAIERCPDPTTLGAEMFKILKTGDKAAFALDLLWLEDPKALRVPKYVYEGLNWLQGQLRRKQVEVLASIPVAESIGDK